MKPGDVYFEVTIKRVEAVEEKDQKWQQVADSGNPRDGGVLYDYAPLTVVRHQERVILHQQVEQISVEAVVLAVLGITPG